MALDGRRCAESAETETHAQARTEAEKTTQKSPNRLENKWAMRRKIR